MYKVKTLLLFSALSWTTLPAQNNDDFNDSSTKNIWDIHQAGPNNLNYYATLEINGDIIMGSPVGGTAGYLTLIPGPHHVVWFNNEMGPMLTQKVSGNFVVSTHVKARNKNDLDAVPLSDFNAAGLIARNPNTTGNENYVVVNLGMQSVQNGIGVEAKTTINGVSTFFLTPDISEGELRICRIGNTFRLYKKTTDTALLLMKTFERPDLPSTLDVGIMANGYDPGNTFPPDLRAEFDYVYFATIENEAGCTASITNIDEVTEQPANVSWNIYPNPFGDKTQIEYDIAKSTGISIAIYDLNGHLVKVLIDSKSQTVGTYYLELNDTEITAGIYVCKLLTDESTFFKRVVKIK